jgi:murein DD-endopeptidase MepM/ murein hydrolase activator NlpD
MERRVVVAILIGVLLLAAPAGGDPGDEKAHVDQQLGDVRARIDESGRQAGVLTSELSALSGQIRAAQGQIQAEESRLTTLEAELASRRAALQTLGRRIRAQTARLGILREQHERAVRILERRVREIYMSDAPDLLSFVLATTSFADVLDNLEFLQRIGRQDEHIVREVGRARDALRRLRAETRRERAAAARAERIVADRTESQRAVRDRVVASRDALVAAEREKHAALASVRVDKQQFLAEADELQGRSAALAQEIEAAQAARAAQAAAAPVPAAASPQAGAPSAAGFVWPVQGAVTSGFGARWGRMHEGVDIAAPFGAPVVAVAAGVVVETGWHDGFGNLVVIDHGGGLQTYYAHNSAFAVAAGTTVSQGQVVSYVGSTGHSTGPHCHLEVHVDGVPVDPMGYL